MKKIQFKIIFSTVIFASMLMVAVSINAAPVKFKQVVQVVNATPGKAGTANFSKLNVVSDPVNVNTGGDGDGDGDDKKKKTAEAPPQDGRVITITTAEITENTEEECQCDEAAPFVTTRGGFPKWPLFGLGAVPLAFIKTPEDGPTPTPTSTPPTTATPTPPTQTPTPEPPVPEPMTLLLFGTGLAGVGLAARKRFGKKTEGEEETESVE